MVYCNDWHKIFTYVRLNYYNIYKETIEKRLTLYEDDDCNYLSV